MFSSLLPRRSLFAISHHVLPKRFATSYQVNRVTLLGKVAQDPVQNKTEGADGKVLTKLQVATSESWLAADGQKVIRTFYHNVITWNEWTGTVIMQKAKKGASVYIEGSLEYSEYMDKQTNMKRRITNVKLGNRESRFLIVADPKPADMRSEDTQGTESVQAGGHISRPIQNQGQSGYGNKN